MSTTLVWSTLVLCGVYMRPILFSQATGIAWNGVWSLLSSNRSTRDDKEVKILENQQRIINIMETQMVYLIREVRSLKGGGGGGGNNSADRGGLSDSVYLITEEEVGTEDATIGCTENTTTKDSDSDYIIINGIP